MPKSDFKSQIRGISPNYLTVGIPYVENLIMSVTKGKISSSQSAFRKLERAIVMSTKFKNNILKEQAIKAFRTYEKKVGAIGKPGLWRRSYEFASLDIVLNFLFKEESYYEKSLSFTTQHTPEV